MCRWFSYFSTDEILLEDALVNPVHAITQQARGDFQEENLLNADGFGVAWYTNTWSEYDKRQTGAHPVLYRATTGKPMNDTTFRYLCRSTSSNVIMSHIRGSFGSVASTNNHPFVFGRSSFMHNGFIMRFKDIRGDMMDIISRKYARMVGGSTDTEHLAALYFTYLDIEPHDGFFGDSEKKYPASSMWNAMRHAVLKVEEIQLKHFGMKLNNTLNLCTTNGESLVALCYRTNPWAPPATLYASFTVGDEMNRKKKETFEGLDTRSNQELAQAANAFKLDVDSLTSKDIDDREISHVVVGSEPVNFEPGDWYKMNSGQAILVDKEASNSSVKVALESMPTARVACVLHPQKDKQVIMFHNNLLAVIDVSGRSKTVLGRPMELVSTFEATAAALPRLSSGVDGVIPNPKNKRQMHLFGGKMYLFVDVNTEGAVPSFKVLKGPFHIDDVWTCLKGIKKFKSVSSAVQVPNRPDYEAWFFSEDEYVRVSWTQNEDGSVKSSKLLETPTNISVGWRSLDRADFSGVDMTLPHWNNGNQILFFSGVHYAIVGIDSKPKKPRDSPKGRRRSVIPDWPACFYEPPNFASIPSFNDLGQEDTALLATMVNPDNLKEVFFFSGSRCVGVDLEGIVLRGPMEISASPLGALGGQAWTSGLDGVLPNPPKRGQVMHIFSGDKCSAIDLPRTTSTMTIRQGAVDIVKGWDCLKEAGFKTIDTLLQVPGSPDEVWFFSCDEFIRAKWQQQDDGSVKSTKLEGPQQIIRGWPALEQNKFFQIDATLPDPKNEGNVWFFFDKECILLTVGADPKDSKVVKPPQDISEVLPSLKCFFD